MFKRKIYKLLVRIACNCNYYYGEFKNTGDDKFRELLINELGCFRGITYMLPDKDLVKVYKIKFPNVDYLTDTFVKR